MNTIVREGVLIKMIDTTTNLQFIKGVGPAKIEVLNKMGLYTVEDLINYFPRDYEDRGIYKKIAEVQDGEVVTINAYLTSNVTENRIRRNMSIFKAIIKDETGSAIVTWFNQPYIRNQLKIGAEYSFYGKVKNTLGRIELSSPIFEDVNANKNTGKIIPKYPLINGITQNVFRKIMENVVNAVEGTLVETLPEWITKKEKLPDVNWCMKHIHFPYVLDDFQKARYRVAYEELLTMALALFRFKEIDFPRLLLNCFKYPKSAAFE